MTLVLVTRPAAQCAHLVALLRSRGLDAAAVPTVEIRPNTADLDRAIDRLSGVAWLIVTSANGAEALVDRLAGRGIPTRTRVAAVGPATADALQAGGIAVDEMPAEYLSVNIADLLGELAGRRVILARADVATRDLPEILLSRGALLDEVIAYRTLEAPPTSREPLRDAIHRDVDALTFTSSSSVAGLFTLLSPGDRHRASALPSFCIGPVTAAAGERAGLRIAGVADDHTASGLADTVAAYFRTEMA